MKKILLTVLGTLMCLGIALALLAPTLLGFSITQLGHAVSVATGMGAKLACSGRYVSGFSEAQNLEDLASYSPANRLLDLRYEDNPKRVTATLFGLGETRASYRPGLGCTLEIGDTAALDGVSLTALAPLTPSDAPWPAGNETPHIDETLQQTLDDMVASDNAAGLHTRAFLVIQNGNLVAESYGEGINAQTPLLGWSMGKSLTSMMVGRLQALQPQLEVSQPLFPEWSDNRGEVSLENLLQMSSGLDFDETYAPGSDATRMLFTSHSASSVAMQSALKFTPGEHFSYSSGTTNLLARWIYEHVGGTPQASADFFQQQILAPLGMRDTVFEVDASGVFVGSSYIYASARDWARLGQLMLNRGNWNGEQLLAESWVDAAQQPNHSDNDPRYGYQFWLNGGGDELRFPQLPEDSFFMLGNRAQAVMISPSTNTVVVRLGWTAGDYPTGENFARLLP